MPLSLSASYACTAWKMRLGEGQDIDLAGRQLRSLEAVPARLALPRRSATRPVSPMRPAMRFVFAAHRAFQTPADCQQLAWPRRGRGTQRTPAGRRAARTAAVAAQPNPLLSVANLDWISDKALGDRSPEYLEACKSSVALLIEIIGDKPVGSYSKADVREFKSILKQFLANRSKLQAP